MAKFNCIKTKTKSSVPTLLSSVVLMCGIAFFYKCNLVLVLMLDGQGHSDIEFENHFCSVTREPFDTAIKFDRTTTVNE
jgi:hypothetical protein